MSSLILARPCVLCRGCLSTVCSVFILVAAPFSEDQSTAPVGSDLQPTIDETMGSADAPTSPETAGAEAAATSSEAPSTDAPSTSASTVAAREVMPLLQ